LKQNGIYSAPVRGKDGIIGLLDMLDILTFATMKFSTINLAAWDSYRQMDEFTSKRVGDLIGISGRNEWKPISYNAPLTQVLQILSDPNIHRVPVVNERNDVVGIITQSLIVNFINSNRGRLGKSFLNEKVGDCFLRTKVHTVNSEEFLIEAFRKIFENNITAVAVVDREGKFIGAISPSDLKVNSHSSFTQQF
jgi:CBS domain-containing protein